MAYLKGYCDAPRSKRYYVSNSTGNDSNAGTQASPWKTLAKVQSSLASDTEYSFLCGDEWNETVGITLSVPNVTLSCYGTGPKPFFNAFAGKITSGWALTSGTTWGVTVASNSVGYFRLTGSALPQTLSGLSSYFTATLGANLFPLWAMTTLAACEASVGTWYFDSATSTIYFNTGDSSTAPPPSEYIITGTLNGININNVDGCCVKNIRADGWGVSGVGGAGGNSENIPFFIWTSGTDAAYLENVEAYFSDAHLIGWLDSPLGYTGGIFATKNVKFGFCGASGSGSASIINFTEGNGVEIYHDGPESVAGALPAASATPPANNYSSNGQAVLSHGALFSLVHVRNLKLSQQTRCLSPDASQLVLSSPPALPSPENAICIFFGTRCDPAPAGISLNANVIPFYFGSFATIWVNCKWKESFSGSQVETYSGYSADQVLYAGWMVNCDVDLNNLDTHTVVSLNVNGGPPPNFQNFSADFCRFSFSGNWDTAANSCFMIEHPTTDVSVRNSNFVMNTDVVMGSGHYEAFAQIANNAYTYGAFPVGTSTGQWNDASPAEIPGALSSEYVPVSGDNLYQKGNISLAGAIVPDFDIDGNPRNLATPNIGPREVNPGLVMPTVGRQAGSFAGTGVVQRSAGAFSRN